MKVPATQPLRTNSPRHLPQVAVVVCLLLVPGLAGCRSDASQQDAYIRDLRMHEQQIYELQDYMTEYQELLRQQRKENATLREQLAHRAAPSSDNLLDDVPERSLLDPPRRESPEPLEYEPDDLPQIDPGEPLPTNIVPETPERPLPETLLPETLPDGQSRARTRDGAVRTVAASHVDNQDRERGRTSQFVPPPPPEEPADTVAIYAEQMALEPVTSDEPQEVGLMAIVEPMTSRGTSGRFQGELSLMIVDPIAEEDGNWQIARWDYTIEEIEQAWRDPSRRVLDLPLAAPPSTPLGRPLELWVRLVPTSGEEKILSRTMIELAPPTRLVGVPISGQGSQDASELVSSGWQAAEGLHPPKSADTHSEGSWKPSEVAASQKTPSTRQLPNSSTPLQTADQPKQESHGWTPKR